MTATVDRPFVQVFTDEYMHLLELRAALRMVLEPDGFWLGYRGESATIEHLREVLAEHESDRYRTAS